MKVQAAFETPFPVVGIGASAGGLDAIRQFLLAVPEKSGMAYVFVQHLSPTHESTLPDILKKSSRIPVHAITDNVHLEPDNLYIIPENKILTATDGVLKLAPMGDKHRLIKVINLFFSSLAVIHQSYAVGVVLSGTLTDGTLGLQAIKAYGGITFAQDEESAAYDGMPKSAIDKGVVDFVLPPAKIAEHLISINRLFQPESATAISTEGAAANDDEVFKQILTILRVRRGVDFTYYRTSTLKRRIIRRMALNNIVKPYDYLGLLRDNKQEQDALYNDMLISVTNFFRDPSSFELLCSTIFPEILKHKKAEDPLRIWIAGCATGEEAYSMAICLQELLGDKTAAMKIQVFASDISETAIAKARSGIYRPTDLEGLSPLQLEQFFTRNEGNYQINKVIRDMCVFANHNLLTDPPFSKIDLISCRNVLIYVEPVLQLKALTTFHYALNENGFLMLGKSETTINKTELFAPYNNQDKIFRRQGIRGRYMQVTSQGSEQNFKNIDKSIRKEGVQNDISKIVDDIILLRYAPSGVLINEKFDIIQFRGITDTWLTLSPGKASLNLIKMAREGLAFELRNLLHVAKRTNAPAHKDGVAYISNKQQEYVNVEVSPVPGAVEPHYLVIFEAGLNPSSLQEALSGKSKASRNDARNQRIVQLEKELIQGRADMRTVTEEQELVYDELQSANQELLSGSEELQSLNEELETSKEELQSTNEEIIIVNTELIDRNEQLNNAQVYTEGIINTIGDPFLILDKDLKVKRATSGFYKKFKVTELETEGQYLYNLGNQQWDIPALRVLLESILPEKKIVTNFEVIHSFPSIGNSVMRLNARQLEKANGEQMILLAIDDITAKRKVEEGLAEVEKLFIESKERLRFAVDSAGLGTWDYNPLSGLLNLDFGCKAMFGIPASEELDYHHFIEHIHPEDRIQVDQAIQLSLTNKNKSEFTTELRIASSSEDTPKWLKFKGESYFNKEGIAYRCIGTVLDITFQKVMDESRLELIRKKDEFISIASHELKTPVTTLKSFLQIIERNASNKEEMKPIYPFVQKALRQVNKLTELINDLLDVGKIQGGKMELDRTSFVMKDLLEECMEPLQLEAIGYTISLEGEPGIKVLADRLRLEQVIINFMSNAVKYSPLSKKVNVMVTEFDKWVKVAVSDSGIGIPKDKIPFIFDRFFRVEEVAKKYSGLGLGLYISSEVIKRHGGEIGIESEEGVGSTFWFSIPK